MSRARVTWARTVAQVGLEAREVTVEVHVSGGLPGFHVIGSSGAPAREAADRVRTALAASGLAVGSRKVLISLAPADVPKLGARFDLPTALAVCAQLEVLGQEALRDVVLLGELALDGTVRPVPGVLPSAVHAARTGVRRLVVARGNAAEAALASGVDVAAVADLTEAVAVLGGAPARPIEPPAAPPSLRARGDLAEVRGQLEARRALEIAAAGGHHLLLIGPPGCGKSMLASRLPTILPPLDDAAALELAAIRSVAGLLDGVALDRTPPFRAPHHSASAAALLGGGAGVARPGEVSLATHGVLFLDELLEWPRRLLDALREPLEEGVVRIARSRASVAYPAAAQLVAAANPCPCGGGRRCVCREADVARYRARLSGPLADRIDLAPTVTPVGAADLLAAEEGEPSAAVAARVAAAREASALRQGRGVRNAEADAVTLRASARPAALAQLAAAVDAGLLTARGHDRALRVARTCADLGGVDAIDADHAAEALGHRLALPEAVAG